MSTSTSSPHGSLNGAVGPLDEAGRLLHEDDPAAQLALAVCLLEEQLAPHGLADLAGLRVLTTDRAALADVVDVLTERLDATGARPVVEVEERPGLGVPGMLLALQPLLGTPAPTDAPTGTHTHEGRSMTTTPTHSADALRGLPDVHLPGDPGYDELRLPWNLAVDQRPAAVAVPRSVEQVVDVVRAAGAAGLRVAPQSTGHGAGPLAGVPMDDVVLLRLSELTGVSVDAVDRTARVVGGTQWHEVVAAAAPYGLTALHGSAPDVAVAGYLLGGGLSFYARKHGLGSGSLRAVELVTADGTLLRADAHENAEVFWAVRGGGGSFGVATALEMDLLPVTDLVGGMLLWDRERAPEVVPAWAAWTRDVPDTVTTSLRVMSFPPLPELPPFLSGRHLVIVDGAVLEDDDRASELLAPLRALAPEMDTFARMPAAGLTAVHMDPPAPVPAVSEHTVLSSLDDTAVDAFLAQVGPGTASGLMFAELRQLGGALATPAPGGGAVDHLPGAYAVFAIAPAPTPEAATAGLAAGERLVDALSPWAQERRFLNFTDNGGRAASGFAPETWERLRAVRDTVDPGRLFLANHEVG
ncbi:FAD-binding oxidoreductase [Nocardioides taihuensis]|uniref:FAD-binding oxidoreductase n=1 Tax=Nocardioides taihuensis TaxID=1835606 RepID=A0ABW0BLJ2_9ACTN